MGEYFVTYKGKKKEGVNIYYEVDYLRRGKDGLEKAFTLYPILQVNERMGNVSEPSTQRFLTHDIYTHVTYVDPEDILTEKQKAEEGYDRVYKKPRIKTVKPGDTIITSNSMVIFKGIDREIRKDSMGLLSTDLAAGARLEIIDVNKKRYEVTPVFVLRGNVTIPVEAVVGELGLKISFTKVHPEKGQVDLAISEKRSNSRDFIIMKAIVFPYINFLWTGCILFITGCIIAIRRRVKLKPES
jgi:cytochrome c-type biogenesis protein CcmF